MSKEVLQDTSFWRAHILPNGAFAFGTQTRHKSYAIDLAQGLTLIIAPKETEMIQEVLREAEGKMKKAVEALRHNLSTIRTGRASTGLVEHLPVEAYGSTMPLNQLAGISTPEGRMIVIQPFDTSTLKAIEKAIQNSELGLTPTNDGRLIRLTIPPLNEARRRELVKMVRARVEESKVAVRNLRREAVDDLRQFEQEKMISEDELRRGQEKIQDLTDRYSKELDAVGSQKEAEVMEV